MPLSLFSGRSALFAVVHANRTTTIQAISSGMSVVVLLLKVQALSTRLRPKSRNRSDILFSPEHWDLALQVVARRKIVQDCYFSEDNRYSWSENKQRIRAWAAPTATSCSTEFGADAFW